MRPRLTSLSALTLLLAACSGGPPSPPALAYGLPSPSEVVYGYGDTTEVRISAMGQSLELSQLGTAEFGLAFHETTSGLTVRLTVAELAAVINQPMGAPLRIDRSDVRGDLVFSLDRMGNATISEQPQVSEAASQMVSSLGLAHTFFPGLPGRAVDIGESWVDTVFYQGPQGPGATMERTILKYTVLGDTLVVGRSLFLIMMEGTSKSSRDLTVAGMDISQTSDLVVGGHILWDVQRGILFESFKTSKGEGTVNVPISPVPLPIEIESTQRARLQGH